MGSSFVWTSLFRLFVEYKCLDHAVDLLEERLDTPAQQSPFMQSSRSTLKDLPLDLVAVLHSVVQHPGPGSAEERLALVERMDKLVGAINNQVQSLSILN